MAFFLAPLAMTAGRAALRYGLPALVRTGQNIMRGRGVMTPGAYRGLKPGGTKAALGKRTMQGLGIADLGFGISGAQDIAQGLRGVDRPEDSMYGAAEPQQRVVQGVGELGISSLFTPELVKAFGMKGKAINKFSNFIGSTGSLGNRAARGLGVGVTSSVGSGFIPSNKPGAQFSDKFLSDPTLTSQYPFSLESKDITESTKASDVKDASLEQVGDSTYAIKAKGIVDPKKTTDARRKTSGGRNRQAVDTRQTFEEVLNEEYAKIVEAEDIKKEKETEAMKKIATTNQKVRLNLDEDQNPAGEIRENSIEAVNENIDERVVGGDSATNNFMVNTGEELLNEEEQGSPDETGDERKYFDFMEGYAEANRLIEREKAKLTDEKRQTFDEFYDEFRKNAGLDVPDQTANYAAYNFFNNLSAPTNATGMAGFAEAAARASKIYSEDMLQLYQTEKQTRAKLAADFLTHNRTLDAQAGSDMSALLKEQRANLISESKDVQDYIKARDKHIMDVAEAKRGKLQPGENRFSFVMPYEEGKYMKLKTYQISESKDTGEKLVQIQTEDGRPIFVPFDSEELNQPRYADLKKAMLNPDQYGAYSVPILEAKMRLEPVTMMNKADQAMKNIVQVLDIANKFPSLISGGGAFRQLKEKVIGVPLEIFKAIGNLDEVVFDGFEQVNSNSGAILNEIRSKAQGGDFNAKAYNTIRKNLEEGNKQMTEAQERLIAVSKPDSVMTYNGFKSNEMYQVKDGNGAMQSISGSEIIKTISQLEIIETRMKYLLANVYKEKDRLTVYDLQEMARNTDIVSFSKTPNQIIGSYEKLLQDMNDIYKQKLDEAVGRGVLINHMNGQFKNHHYFTRGRSTEAGVSNNSLIEFGGGPTKVPNKDDLKSYDIEGDLKGFDDLPITPEKTEEKPVEVQRSRRSRR